MKHPAWLIVLASLLGAGTAAPAQEAYTLKLKDRGEGEATLVKRKEMTAAKVTIIDANEQVLIDQRENKTEIQEYKETTLKRAPGQTTATKLERVYSKAQSLKDDQTDDLGLQGKTVLIEKKGDKYTFTYKDGAEVTGAAAAALRRDFDKKNDNSAELERLVLPKGAVKNGDSWKLDMPKIVAELSKQAGKGMELNGAKATGQGTLVKAYKKDGRQFGEMKFTMEMPMVSIGEGKEQMKFTAGAKIVLDMTLDTCIDGSSDTGTMKLKMNMTGIATLGQLPGATARMDVTFEGSQAQAEPAKK